MRSKVLAIDNDAIFLAGLKSLLADSGIDLDTAPGAHEGVSAILATPEKYRAVLLDYEMPALKGDAVARKLKEVNSALKIIMLSGTEDENVVRTCYAAGAERFLLKGQDSAQTIEALLSVLTEGEAEEIASDEAADSAAQNARTIETILRMSGCSRAMAHVATLVERYAKSNENVLILGESGVGKEGVARAIHANSSRRDKPFVAINCGAIPRDLLESELFGHERGAFTGATIAKKGKFLLANNGTLFLDEIGDLDLSLQVKILRALQEKTIEPVGSHNSIKLNIRIIAATHRKLPDLVSAGQFREDLYYRLKVLPIAIPPLRERPEDIEPLIKHFVALQERESGTKKKISDAAMRTLKSLPWPGNVRQLEASVKYAFVNSVRVIQAESLEPDLVSGAKARLQELARKSGLMTHAEFTEQVAEMERALLQEALRLAGNVKSAAAEILGMSHQAMNYRRLTLGLDSGNKTETKKQSMEVVI